MSYPEQEQPDPLAAAFFQVIMAQVSKHACVVVEVGLCPTCGEQSTHAHNFAETLGCMHEGCSGRWQSKAPRPPLKGEVTADNYRSAMEALHDANVLQIRDGRPKPGLEELSALPAGTRLLLERACLAASREAILKVIAVAEQLARL